MRIEILQLIEGAKNARGLTVVIDVFRAMSVEYYLMGNGAARIIPLGDLEQAYELKRRHPEYVLVGERLGVKPAGFDSGNSPTEIEHADLRGKTIVHTTSAGTPGIVHAVNADEIVIGGFVAADAIIKYIKRRNPQHLSLVALGLDGMQPTEEDTLFAEFVRNALLGIPNDYGRIIERLRQSEEGKTFFDPDQDFRPERDFHLCLDLDRFDFMLKVYKERDGLVVKKASMSKAKPKKTAKPKKK